MHSLPLFHRIAGQTVIVLGEGDAADAKRRLVERVGGKPTSDERADAKLAFVALDNPETPAQRLKERGVLVNVADRPDLCDFTLPSILERGPVVLAVGTGGASAGLAKALRMRLETLLPHSLGHLAEALGAARQRMRMRWPDPVERRTRIDRALAKGGELDPLCEFDQTHLESWLEREDPKVGGLHGTISITQVEVILNSSDPDDLTLHQARYLAQADIVIHDSDVPGAILALARADASRCLIGEELPGSRAGLIVTLRSR